MGALGLAIAAHRRRLGDGCDVTDCACNAAAGITPQPGDPCYIGPPVSPGYTTTDRGGVMYAVPTAQTKIFSNPFVWAGIGGAALVGLGALAAFSRSRIRTAGYGNLRELPDPSKKLLLAGGGILAGAAIGYGVVQSLGPDPEPPGTDITDVGYVDGNAMTITLRGVGGKFFLVPGAADAFNAMNAAAAAAGIGGGTGFNITYAFRTMAQQYWQYIKGGSYLTGGTANTPGTSPHQRGIAVDLDVGTSSRGEAGNNDAWAWLNANASKFGFINDYAVKKGAGEAWHWQWTGDPSPWLGVAQAA